MGEHGQVLEGRARDVQIAKLLGWRKITESPAGRPLIKHHWETPAGGVVEYEDLPMWTTNEDDAMQLWHDLPAPKTITVDESGVYTVAWRACFWRISAPGFAEAVSGAWVVYQHVLRSIK